MNPEGMRAIREGVAITHADHFTTLRFSGGDGAWETLSWLTSGELFLRDGQVLHSLWLDERAHPLADVYVLRDDESFVVVAESQGADIVAHAHDNVRGDAVIDALGATHRVLSLNGPFAWELLGDIVGPDVVSLPYMASFRMDGGWALRAGKTGEFGYDLVLPVERADAIEARLRERGARFDLADAPLEVLESCMLENWFFNVRREGRLDVTPLELQLQWRTTRGREYLGAPALDARRAEGPRQRLTMLLPSARVHEGDEVHLWGDVVGTIVNASDGAALALIDLAWAHPGIDAFEVSPARTPARSVTPPLANNRSLHVNPQQHSYATRDEIAFPPLFSR